jgi:predicted N-acyltransferase
LYTVKWLSSISETDEEAWNALTDPLDTPLLDWEWLRRMEISGSVAPETGWLPHHLTLWSDGQLICAAPLYIKGHSSGEFVWDYMWADVASQLGVRYYPKMVGMSPATPAPGYRFLVAPGEEEETLTHLMVDQIDRFCQKHGISGCAFNFVDPEWHPLIESAGFTAWRHQSYAWWNEDFQTFDDYLAVFNKNQRRNIRRERRSVEEAGIRVEPLQGEQIPDSYFRLMYGFYEQTNAQFGPWAAKYLTREFFLGLAERYKHRLLLVAAMAPDDDVPIGMSFLLTKGEQLIGRYWGASRWVNNLHFDVCYYAPIQWAIENGIRVFDPGAGSPHKIRRGFRAVANHSLHRFYDNNMRLVMQAHIDEINRMEQEHIEGLNESLPFKDQNNSPARAER